MIEAAIILAIYVVTTGVLLGVSYVCLLYIRGLAGKDPTQIEIRDITQMSLLWPVIVVVVAVTIPICVIQVIYEDSIRIFRNYIRGICK